MLRTACIGARGTAYLHWNASSCFLLRYSSFQSRYFIIYRVQHPLTCPNRAGCLAWLLFKDWRVLPCCGTFSSFTGTPQISTGQKLSTAFKERHMLSLHPRCPCCIFIAWYQSIKYSKSQSGHFVGSDYTSLSLEGTQRPLRPLFISTSVLVSTFMSQIFTMHSSRKTTFFLGSRIYRSCWIQSVCGEVKKMKKKKKNTS